MSELVIVKTASVVRRIAEMNAIDRWLVKQQFNAELRKQMYETLGVLVDNNVMMLTALRDLYAVASDEGAKPKTTLALIVQDVIDSLSAGKSFSQAMTPWVGTEEASILAAGEQSGKLRVAFGDAIGLIASKKRIRAAALSLVLYPSVLGALLCGVLFVISAVVVPKLTGIADPATWEGFAKMLYVISEAVMGSGLYMAALNFPLLGLIVWSMANYTGRLRAQLDRFPPWSLYRRVNGAIFMLNVSVMLRAGVKLHDALLITSRHANPWLRQRIVQIINGTSVGRNLGEAMAATGFDFPDRESIRYIRTLAGLDGFDRGLNEYAHASLERTISLIEKTAKALFLVAIVVIVLFVLMVVGAISDIQSAIDAGIQR